MTWNNRHLLSLSAVLLTLISLAACNTMERAKKAGSPAAKVEKTALANKESGIVEYYEVYHQNGRLYVFGEQETYLKFLKYGETPYTQTRIAAGPQRQTLIFGLAKKDKKKRTGIGHIDVYDAKAEGADQGFYGELVKEARYYVFDSWKDMKEFRRVGEATYTFTAVGSGPNRATVIYVRNKGNKKIHPAALVARFGELRGRIN